jgi:hypothetical protein
MTMNTMDKTYEGLMQMISLQKKCSHHKIKHWIQANGEYYSIWEGGVGGVKAGENKVSGVQVRKRYVRVKNIDDRCYFRKFSM